MHAYYRPILPVLTRRFYTSGQPLMSGVSTIRQILIKQHAGQPTCIHGWIRSVRKQKNMAFVDVNDGSCMRGIQVIVDQPIDGLAAGCAVQIDGHLVDSPGHEQSLELHARNIKVVGECDAEKYPLQKKRHTLEFLREWPHLRSRTHTMGAVLRIRNQAIHRLHQFFQNNDFLQINTPILTAHDCEGGGEVFRVSTNTPAVHGSNKVEDGLDSSNNEFLLHLEAIAMAASRVYTLSPTFRAEPSQTSRHLAEFWMLEAEMSFITELDQLMDLCESCIVNTTRQLRTTLPDEINLFKRWVDPELEKRLALLAADQQQSYARMTYTEAIEVLQKAPVSFKFAPTWGAPLQSEHEQYLADRHCQRPVFVTHYPASIKPFYMLVDPASASESDKSTVACMDLLVPGVGELVGGSLRESNEATLRTRMEKAGVDPQAHAWYLDLRRFGGVPHGGFGLGLERYLRAVTGIASIKDLIPCHDPLANVPASYDDRVHIALLGDLAV
ncbi:asparaginyl-tRNA synthetase [Syncephalis fuscata]|nr:asparaginyl-tRNA synthetase [Syncephalis fuscata]